MSPYFYLFDAIENTIATLKEWQERLVEQRKSNMELENLILYLIKVEQTAEEWDFGAEQRRLPRRSGSGSPEIPARTENEDSSVPHGIARGCPMLPWAPGQG